jgi:hypothetical protein
MDFVNPALLGGAVLAAIPVIMHFAMRQRPKRIEFPALRFVRQRRDANQRRMKIQHWLLLLLRIAAVCLLAFALARPSMRAAGEGAGGQGPIAAALIFDTSPRMEYRHENRTRLEAAQRFAADLLGDFPDESQVAVIDSRGQPVVFQIDLPAAGDRIERLEITPAAQPLEASLEEAVRVLSQSDRQRKEIYIFTDLAAAAWSVQPAALQRRLAELHGVDVYVVDVGVPTPHNFALGEVQLSAQVLSRTSPLTISTDIVAQAASGERSVVLELLDSVGKPQKRSQATFDLRAEEPQRVEFTLGGLATGLHQGQLRLVGADGLPGDDLRFFTVEVQPAWRVLIAAPKPTQISASYLYEALAPTRFRQQGLARFECDVISHDDLENTELRPYVALFVLDPPVLPLRAWQRISEFVQAGGGAALFLGEQVGAADAFNQSAASLLPARVKMPQDGPTHLVTTGGNHPILQKFGSLGDQVPWDQFPVNRYWGLSETSDGASAIVSFADGGPALVEQPLGSGRVLMMTTPLSDAPDKQPRPWNRLLTGLRPWPCFMFVNELALYLVGSSDSQLNYLSGQPASLRLRPDQRVANYLLITPRDEHIKGSVPARQDSITVAVTETPGHYRVRSGGQQGLDKGFSVNLQDRATSLARLAPEELPRIFGEQPFRLARSLEDMQRQVSTGRLGQEFYPLLIVLVAVAVGLEQVVANRFYRQDQLSKD